MTKITPIEMAEAKDRDFLFPIWGRLFDKYKIPENMRYKI